MGGYGKSAGLKTSGLILIICMSVFAGRSSTDTAVVRDLLRADTAIANLDSTSARTVHINAAPAAASLGDSCVFLLRGEITRCTRAQYLAGIGGAASAHTHTTLDTVNIRAIGGPTKTDSTYGVKGNKNAVGFFGALFGNATTATRADSADKSNPTSAAGGGLGGSYPNPTVDGMTGGVADTAVDADKLDGLHSSSFQLTLTNPVTGTGTTNYHAKFTGASTIGNGLIYDNGTYVNVGGTYTDIASNFSVAGAGDKTVTIASTNNEVNLYLSRATTGHNAFIRWWLNNSAVPWTMGLYAGQTDWYLKSGSTSAFQVSVDGDVGFSTPSNAYYKAWFVQNKTNATGTVIQADHTQTVTTNSNVSGYGMSFSALSNISGGVDNTGYLLGMNGSAFHNSAGNYTGSGGPIGINCGYGNLTGSGNSATVNGLLLTGYQQSGTIGTYKDINIPAPPSGATVTNDYCIYSAHDALSYFAGAMKFGKYSTGIAHLDADGDVTSSAITAAECAAAVANGTAGTIAKYTAQNTIGNSAHLTETATGVGIGATPSTKLRLIGTPISSADYFNGTIASFETNASDGLAIIKPATNEMGLKVNSGRSFVFGVGDASLMEILRLSSTGNVGINAPTPTSARLEVVNSSASIEGLRVFQSTTGRTTSGKALALFYDDQAGTDQVTIKAIQNGSGDILQLNNGSDVRLLAKADGKVGIGTTAPDSTFDIHGAAGAGSLNVDGNARMGGYLNAVGGFNRILDIGAAPAGAIAQYTASTNVIGPNPSWRFTAGILEGLSVSATMKTGGAVYCTSYVHALKCIKNFIPNADTTSIRMFGNGYGFQVCNTGTTQSGPLLMESYGGIGNSVLTIDDSGKVHRGDNTTWTRGFVMADDTGIVHSVKGNQISTYFGESDTFVVHKAHIDSLKSSALIQAATLQIGFYAGSTNPPCLDSLYILDGAQDTLLVGQGGKVWKFLPIANQ